MILLTKLNKKILKTPRKQLRKIYLTFSGIVLLLLYTRINIYTNPLRELTL